MRAVEAQPGGDFPEGGDFNDSLPDLPTLRVPVPASEPPIERNEVRDEHEDELGETDETDAEDDSESELLIDLDDFDDDELFGRPRR